jgi:uncharacterized membrane protein
MITNRNMRILSIILAVSGVIVSGYLSWVKLAHAQVFCGGSGECELVANSPYAEIVGIPIAFLGLGAYIVITGLLLLENYGDFWKQNSPLIIFGMTLVGLLYSAFLTYLEIAVIRAICPYCVVSAIIMTLLFIIAIIRLFRHEPEPKSIRARGG